MVYCGLNSYRVRVIALFPNIFTYSLFSCDVIIVTFKLDTFPHFLIECVHCHAIKNKIKNYATDKVKKIVILQTINKEDSSPSLSCVRCPKAKVFAEMFRTKITERSMDPPCWRTSLVLEHDGQ